MYGRHSVSLSDVARIVEAVGACDAEVPAPVSWRAGVAFAAAELTGASTGAVLEFSAEGGLLGHSVWPRPSTHQPPCNGGLVAGPARHSALAGTPLEELALVAAVSHSAGAARRLARVARGDRCLTSFCGSLLAAFRRADESAFDPRDAVLLRAFHRALRRSPALSDAADGLPPRCRRTLELLLQGASEKEVARAVYRSPNTVHEHVRTIYRHFKVSSRAELLARAFRTRSAPAPMVFALAHR